MTRLVAICLVLFAFGCVREPPAYVSYDSDFTDAQRETLRAAVAAWGEKVDWHPTEAAWSDRGRFMLVDHLDMKDDAPCPEGLECIVGGRNDGDNIRIAADFLAQEGLDVLYTIGAHEVGHYCTEHTDQGLMAERQRAEDGASDVDAIAVQAWIDGCH